MPVNPNNPATIAITKKTSAQRSIIIPLLRDISRNYATALATTVKKWFWEVPSGFKPENASPASANSSFSESK
jgi:hypothetical protein